VEPAGGGTGGPRCLAEDRSVALCNDNYNLKEQTHKYNTRGTMSNKNPEISPAAVSRVLYHFINNHCTANQQKMQEKKENFFIFFRAYQDFFGLHKKCLQELSFWHTLPVFYKVV
jgi:hypothetical protein